MGEAPSAIHTRNFFNIRDSNKNGKTTWQSSRFSVRLVAHDVIYFPYSNIAFTPSSGLKYVPNGFTVLVLGP